MKPQSVISVLLTGTAATAIALWALMGWMRMPLPEMPARIAIESNRVARVTDTNSVLVTTFRRGSAAPGSLRGSWPGFRGPNHDAIAPSGPPLSREWTANGPRELWRRPLGEGYAGPAVVDGRVYLIDYDEEQKADRLLCLSTDNGEEIWSRAYPVSIKRNHGISRTIPAVAKGVVVSIGPKCHVMACDAVSGEFLWGFDMVARYGTEVPLWYAGQCPRIDGDAVILAPGGPDVLLAALDLRSGKTVWSTPNPDGWKMSHASVAEQTIDGQRTWIYPAIGGIVGVAAGGLGKGEILWQTDAWKHSVVAPTPVPLNDGRFLVTAGYGSGSAVFEVSQLDDDTWRAGQILRLDRREFACEQQTPIFHDGLLYTIQPKDAGDSRNEFICMRPDGTRIWKSGREHRFGLGPFILADGVFLILRDNGELVMAQADSNGFKVLAGHRVITGRDAWAPPALVDGRLFIRDERTMVCLDLR